MPEIFDNGPDDDAFALPGDEQLLERMAATREDEPAAPTPEPAAAAAPAAETADEPPAGPEAPENLPEAPVPSAEETAAREAALAAGLDVDDPEVIAYLEQFGGDPVKALKSAVENRKLFGRQQQELGELRKLVEQRLPEPEPAPQPNYDQDALETWFVENPTRIPQVAEEAYMAGNEQVLNAAIAAWEDVDRAGARAFERKIAVADARRELSAETQQRDQIVGEWNAAAEKFAETHPDLEQVAPKMRELAPQYPHMLQILRTGDPESKIEVLDFLYEKARGQNADNLATTARTIAREQAREAEEAIAGAAVASTSTVVAETPSKADQIAAEWDKADAPYRDGWNV